jgi:phosphoribosylaminoimidazole-succinocarboxamide synthase
MIDQKTIIKNIPDAIDKINFPKLGKRYSGKVRDWYIRDHLRILVATDRISAFDKILGAVPFRGAVLNSLSHFWFEKTRDIVQNHMIGIIDPNVMLVTECQAQPIEVVIRGYITGVTSTSLWKHYSEGERVIYGIKFPEGLVKNQRLKEPVITPTTRGTGPGGHDEQIEKVAFKLFERGTKICDKGGFILADTKYEFGLDRNGKLILIDEIHTPDSSRLWVKATYKERFKKSEEVENYDKEIMRIWFAKQGYIGKGKPPQMSQELIAEIATRYIEVYEKITGEKFEIDLATPPKERILESLSKLI